MTDDSDSEDSLFGGDDSESDSSDDEGDGRPELKGRKKWELKKEVVKTKVNKIKKTVVKPVAGVAVASVAISSSLQMDENMTEEALDRKVNELVSSRGKKSTDPKDVLRKLELLSKVARVFSPKKEIPVLMHVVSTMFGSHRVIDDYMDLSQWRTCYRCLNRIVTLLDENKNIILSLMADEDLSDLILGAGSNSDFIKNKEDNGDNSETVKVINKNEVKVVGSLETFLARLEDEYTKSLQQINPHTHDYVVRLSDEAMLVELAQAVRVYYRRIGDEKSCSSVALLIVEHLYYKHDTIAAAVQKSHIFNTSWGNYGDLHPACKGKMEGISISNTKNVHPGCFLGNPTVELPACDSAAQLDELCKSIFKYGDERNKTRALLCSVYHHALHDRYYRARDMFLISHIQDAIEKMDTKTQILYNRTLVTLGLSAFRQGLISKAHDCLVVICTGKIRELLAQGQARWHDKDPEQEKIERRRQMPYHMHINPDLLECVHLTCAMLLELPHMARGNTDVRNVVSRQFRKYLQSYNRQDFTGPPENTREHVLAAAKYLMAGEWQKACSSILGLEVWNLVPGDGGSKVKEMLNSRMKEEAVRIYLLKYGVHYESLSLAHICQMFDIEEVPARKIISRMIFNKEISGAWEHPANTLVLYNIEPSSLQVLSQQVAEKVATLVESNERVIDPLANSYGYKEDNWTGRQGHDGKTSRQQYYDNDRRGTGGRGSQQRYRTLPNNVTGRNRVNNKGGRGGNTSQGGRSGTRGWGQASN
jgi:translation initiation factor 3 subunit C